MTAGIGMAENGRKILMNEEINELIKESKHSIFSSENSSDNEYAQTYALQSIAYSLLAITKMFSTDYEKSFGGEEHEEH